MPKPSGKQFVTVFHSSDEDTPPHLQGPHPVFHNFTENDNVHRDIVHMGTRAAAQTWTHRQHLHEYRINVNHPSVSPVTFGESPSILNTDQDIDNEVAQIKAQKGDTNEVMDSAAGGLYAHFQERMSGKKTGLFEETAPDTKGAAEKGIVTPYRNRREDAGSVSWMVPKSQIGDEGAVQYVRHFKPRKIVR